MFSDVLGALRRVQGLDGIAVVTDDASAESLAAGDRMIVLRDDRRAGQSEATQIGIAYAGVHGFERVLLVPGDTPLMDSPEVEDLLKRCARDEIQVALVPDRHGTGTNAIVIAPPGCFRPSFGEGSLERHMALARERELVHRVENVPSLAHDVDTPDDLVTLWRGSASRAAVRRERAGRSASSIARACARRYSTPAPGWRSRPDPPDNGFLSAPGGPAGRRPRRVPGRGRAGRTRGRRRARGGA